MNRINFNNIFLISLWKVSVIEVIDNKNYYLPKNITKIAFTLANKRISKKEQDLLELHEWLVIEVEPILINATAEDLEEYLKSHLNEINRSISESEIVNPEFEDIMLKKEDAENSLDSFLNTG